MEVEGVMKYETGMFYDGKESEIAQEYKQEKSMDLGNEKAIEERIHDIEERLNNAGQWAQRLDEGFAKKSASMSSMAAFAVVDAGAAMEKIKVAERMRRIQERKERALRREAELLRNLENLK